MQDVVSNPRKVSADRRKDGMETSMKTAEKRSHSLARGLDHRALSPDDSESRYSHCRGASSTYSRSGTNLDGKICIVQYISDGCDI